MDEPLKNQSLSTLIIEASRVAGLLEAAESVSSPNGLQQLFVKARPALLSAIIAAAKDAEAARREYLDLTEKHLRLSIIARLAYDEENFSLLEPELNRLAEEK